MCSNSNSDSWQYKKIKELSDTYAGGTPSRNAFGMFDGFIPWVKSSELNINEIIDTEEKLTKLGYKSSSVKWVPANTPLVAMYGATAGVVSWLKISAVTNQAVLAVPTRDKSINSRWLYWILQFYSSRLLATVQGSGQPNLSKKLIDELKIDVPLIIAEQQKIAKILDTVEKAIALTQTHINKLKLAKAGLLHDLLTKGIDEHGELRNPKRNPEQFKDSPLGKIPKDWYILPVEALLEGRPKNGYSPKEVDEWTGQLMLGLGCLTPDGFQPYQLKNAPASNPKIDAALLKNGDFLISRSNTRELVALVGVYTDIGIPTIYPDLMMRLITNNKLTVHFLELLMRHEPVRRQLTGAAQGTSGSMVKINSETVLSTITAVPKFEEQQKILQAVNKYNRNVKLKNSKLEKLKLLKLGLMSDLLTGKVRVKI